jgi:SAM-dependent methyltransferase
MQDIHKEFGPKKSWEIMYEKDLTPWNINQIAPGLLNLSARNKIPLEGRFLVPGCGQGFNCFHLVNDKRQVLGIDLSPIIVAANEKQKSERSIKDDLLQFKVIDFFAKDSVMRESSFEFIFDYTFLCALEPAERGNWGEQMSYLIKKGGMLCTLMFPLDGRSGGPPYSLTEAIYHDLLDANFKLELSEECESVARRQGQEKIALWTKIN